MRDRLAWTAFVCGLALAHPAAWAQAPDIGSVPLADATVTPATGQTVAVAGGRATLSGAPTVTASAEHNAPIALTRGGDLLVCRTSVLHLSESSPAARQSDPNLLLSLDRGALEIRHKAEAGDQLLTPDMRISTASAGLLDLRVRVVFEGDTCIENRGRHAPVLDITDTFGDARYELKPGQHVTFVKGDLRQVIDRETTPCGCPPDEGEKMSLADAAIQGRPGDKATAAAAATGNPFPEAQSEGLAPPAPLPAEKPGEQHTEVSSTLTYDPSASAPPTPSAGPPTAPAQSAPAPATPTPQKPAGNPFSAIGRFFKRLFVH